MRAVHTPFADRSEVVDLGRAVFRKQVLPVGSINYRGRRIDFTREYLSSIVESFKKRAFDAVPFMLADRDNTHTLDPERWRGDVRGLELAEDGLYATVELTEDAAKLVQSNPRFGVSARIIEQLERADGRKFGPSIQHVLGTLDPRVTGMKPWETVELSTEDREVEVVDLTSSLFVEGNDMSLTAEEIEQVRALLAGKTTDLSTPTQEEGGGDEGDTGTDEGADNTGAEEDTDAERTLAGLVEEDNDDVDAQGDTDLSAGTVNAIELARLNDAETQIQALRHQLAAERFGNERNQLIDDGVPPELVDLARPLLDTPDPVTVDLSNSGQPVDASGIVRELLKRSAGYIELGRERGHGIELSADDTKRRENDEFDQAWAADFK